MNFEMLLADIARLANTASAVIPGAGLVGSAAGIGSKIIDLIDTVTAHAPPQSQAQLKEARDRLSTIVKAHARATSTDLRG